MTNSHAKKVVIVGGGIAGVALSRALRSHDMPFSILERRHTATEAGLAINLPGNAIQALAQLGLREQVEATGYPLRRRQYRTAQDKLLFEVDEDTFWGEALRPRGMRRSALLSILADGLPNDSIRYGAAVSSLTTHATHAELTLADGTRSDAPLVVGADGVSSTVRVALFGAELGPGRALLADASWRFMAPNPGVDCWTVWAGAEGMVLLMPVDHDEVYGWAATSRPQPHSEAIDTLDRMMGSFPGRVQRAVRHALSQPGELHHSPLEEVRLDHWHIGRAALIGDAAHATAPVWAQGAALAFEDAIVLARSLSATADIPAALTAFEAQRRPRVAHVQKLTDAMSRAAKLPLMVRDTLLPWIGPKRYRQTYEPLKAQV